MLYDISWLAEGKSFPPASEIERLADYRDHKAMFRGELDVVFEAYKTRLRQIAEKFSVMGYAPGDAEFGIDLNYFQLVSTKTMDLLAGDAPSVSGADGVDEIRTHSRFAKKLRTAICDASRYGDALVRVYKDADGKGNCTVISPQMWFPIVDRETNEITAHCICWIEKEEVAFKRTRQVLNAQIHGKGYFDRSRFELKDGQANNEGRSQSGRLIRYDSYRIGGELPVEGNAREKTGLDDFAIVPYQNFVPSDSVYGISDYDVIVSIIAELQVRYAIEDFVLDKHSAPTPYGPSSAVRQNVDGSWSFATGSFVEVGNGEQPPGYMTWDASFQANHAQIEKLEKHLFSLSQMGAVLNDDAFGASQGFEALETRMTNAKLKARRMTDDLTDAVKKTIALMSQIGYARVDENELSVQWNDGLPTNEYRETDIANRKATLFTRKRLLKDHFGLSEEDAEKEVEEKRNEQSEDMASGFSLGIGGAENEGGEDEDETNAE